MSEFIRKPTNVTTLQAKTTSVDFGKKKEFTGNYAAKIKCSSTKLSKTRQAEF